MVNSSTPKAPRFDPTSTPEPEASPVLPIPPANRNPKYLPRTSPCAVTPSSHLDKSAGQIIGPCGNLMNITYVSPAVAQSNAQSSSAVSHNHVRGPGHVEGGSHAMDGTPVSKAQPQPKDEGFRLQRVNTFCLKLFERKCPIDYKV